MLGNACILSKFNLRLQPVLGFLAVAERAMGAMGSGTIAPFCIANDLFTNTCKT